jgi:hypothetical protein
MARRNGGMMWWRTRRFSKVRIAVWISKSPCSTGQNHRFKFQTNDSDNHKSRRSIFLLGIESVGHFMADLPRIYFDTNDGVREDTYALDIAGSMEDIRCLGDLLRPGMRVLLYMSGELEVEATLEYDTEHGRWLGRADMSTLHHLQ